MQYDALIKNLKKSNLSFKKARGGWKNEIKKFLPQTGSEEELKFMIDINDFQPDKFCISNLAFSLIDDEHKNDPAFDSEKSRQAHKFTSEKLNDFFTNNRSLNDLKLNPQERAMFFALLILKEEFFNKECNDRKLNAKLATLVLNGCLISEDYEAVKVSDKELETLQKLHEEQQKNMELQRKEADNLALLITAVASALCKTLAKSAMAHIPLKIA